ncbi:MAG: hypothetical protein M0P69_21865 [Bacteroidales bacterium]|nr:hypothetical protein [Bacteroidales bacterium]
MKKYVLTLEDNGENLSVSAKNEGFHPLELIGLLEWRQKGLIEQMSGRISPDREYVEKEQD